jgi:Flp pilus assembly protein TadD
MTGEDAPLPAVEKSSYHKSTAITAIESKGASSEAAYRRLAAKAAYQLNVTQLSHRIASAMRSQNTALVNRLMKELEKTQGPDSLFLIRLKAYWQIQRNHLEKARELLEQVLAQKPDDKESGMNLAVVDMRAGRIEPARRRLQQLQRLYPEDDEIAVALQKLHR